MCWHGLEYRRDVKKIGVVIGWVVGCVQCTLCIQFIAHACELVGVIVDQRFEEGTPEDIDMR